MTEPNGNEPTIDSFADLPIQPTGSGVADLEIAYEQMKLADGAAAEDAVPTDAANRLPTEVSAATIESSAHSS